MDTSDNTTCKLHWEVKGYTPIPEPEEKIASLEQENIDQAKKIEELMKQLKIAQEKWFLWETLQKAASVLAEKEKSKKLNEDSKVSE